VEKQMFGEFMGTLVLILMGNGVVANVNLKKSYAQDSGWMVIATGWALAVMTGVFTAIACGSSGAHLNPAVTMGFALAPEISASWRLMPRRRSWERLRAPRWCGCTSCRTGA